MGWFTRPKPDSQILREGAKLLTQMSNQNTTVYAMQVYLRSQLIAKGYDADNVNRAVDWLLR
jgi:hypothetical protein